MGFCSVWVLGMGWDSLVWLCSCAILPSDMAFDSI